MSSGRVDGRSGEREDVGVEDKEPWPLSSSSICLVSRIGRQGKLHTSTFELGLHKGCVYERDVGSCERQCKGERGKVGFGEVYLAPTTAMVWVQENSARMKCQMRTAGEHSHLISHARSR